MQLLRRAQVEEEEGREEIVEEEEEEEGEEEEEEDGVCRRGDMPPEFPEERALVVGQVDPPARRQRGNGREVQGGRSLFSKVRDFEFQLPNLS